MSASDWLELCPLTVIWKPLVSRDDYGKPVYGPPKTFPGRRVYKQSRHASKGQHTIGQGVDVIGESQIYILSIPTVPNIQYDDQVYIQGDKEPFPPIVSLNKSSDENGEDLYVKVTLGSANG